MDRKNVAIFLWFISLFFGGPNFREIVVVFTFFLARKYKIRNPVQF